MKPMNSPATDLQPSIAVDQNRLSLTSRQLSGQTGCRECPGASAQGTRRPPERTEWNRANETIQVESDTDRTGARQAEACRKADDFDVRPGHLGPRVGGAKNKSARTTQRRSRLREVFSNLESTSLPEKGAEAKHKSVLPHRVTRCARLEIHRCCLCSFA